MSATEADLDRSEPAFGTLDAIGMPDAMARDIVDALAQPASLVLIAGSRGTGRTTTANALRDASDNRNGATVCEIDVSNSASAAGALEKALSGQRVLAAIEAPDAVSAIGQMRELIADRFLLALTLRVVIAQRLVRRLCSACCKRALAQGSEASLLGFDGPLAVYQPEGCDRCDDGYQGLVGVFEAIKVDETIRRLIATADEPLIASHAFRNAPNMVSAARALVQQGTTSPAEAIRLLRERPLLVSIAVERTPAGDASMGPAP